MHILYDVNHKKLHCAINVFKEINCELIDQIHKTTSFAYTKESPKTIATLIDNFLRDNNIEVKLYRSFWRWSSVLGYTSGGKVIHINERNITSLSSLVGTIAHEVVHVVDNHSLKNFGHGNNVFKQWKLETAPYKIGILAKLLAEGYLNES